MRRILCIAQGFRELADPRKSAADEKTHQDNASYRRATVLNQAAALSSSPPLGRRDDFHERLDSQWKYPTSIELLKRLAARI